MKPELKPCPFCGNHELRIVTEINFECNGVFYHVGCCSCDARIGDRLSEDDAIKGWNRRAET